MPEPHANVRRLPLIVNPAAGRGTGRRHAESMRRVLERSGRTVEIRYSEGSGHIGALVREAASAGCREVLIAGGDGTISEAVNAVLADADRRELDDEQELALGIVPVGTGNDFVKSLGTPRRWRNACEALAIGVAERRRRRVDAGCYNGRWFANSVGIGLDAEVTGAAERLRWLPGALAYPAALAGLLGRGIGAAELEIELDGERLSAPASMLIACNGRWFGGLFHIAPPASLDDGLLSIVIAAPLSRRRLLRLVPRAVRGTHLDAPEASLYTARRLVVEASAPMPLEADGETAEEPVTRLEVSCLPGALSIIA